MFQYSRASIFSGLFRKNGEKWFYLNSDSLFPDHEILIKTKCIIIPGSGLHIYQNPENLGRVREYLITVIQNYPNIKILGICYGHQIMAYSHGSNIVPKEFRIKESEEVKVS